MLLDVLVWVYGGAAAWKLLLKCSFSCWHRSSPTLGPGGVGVAVGVLPVVVEVIVPVQVHGLVQFLCLCCCWKLCCWGCCSWGCQYWCCYCSELLLLLLGGWGGVQVVLLMLLEKVVRVPLLNRVVQMPKLLLGCPCVDGCSTRRRKKLY